MIESFMGIMIVTMYEIRLALRGEKVDSLSLILAFAMLISYFIFYCFVWSICFCVFIERHEAYRKVTCSEGLDDYEKYGNKNDEDNEIQNNNDAENKNNQKDLEEIEEEPVFYEELLADLRGEPFAVFHIPLVLTRILVFTFLIIMFDSFSKGTLPFLFLFLLSFQIYYLFQSIMAPKFEWWPLSNIYRINECFLLVFILVFSMMKSKEYYDECELFLIFSRHFCIIHSHTNFCEHICCNLPPIGILCGFISSAEITSKERRCIKRLSNISQMNQR
ncbi:unnamed protein product [Moneuplotes crassus]|uniref:Uncharacterized protein n=1 Tax=Euplotes crassus TaxID=5936 RepID=A0AAD2D3Z7_EUPCR|nr:unnamed protein product [Moneuplotes crassus]